jgi:two-component system NtrC family sensor kinase
MSEAAKNIKQENKSEPKAAQGQKSPSLPKSAPQFNRRILIVDDEPAIADGIRSLLSPGENNLLPFRKSSRSSQPAASESKAQVTTSYEITVVSNPTDALKAVETALAEERPYAMGFFDVLLGTDIDGIELVKRVQNLDSQLYAVFVTAYHDRSVDSINEFLGGDKADRWDYINKPFTDGEIIQKARSITSLWNLQRMKEWQDDQLADAQKMLLQNERANTVAAVGRSVAHEFGNLLMQIVGHAELAVLKNEPQRMKEALDTILRASETATNVLSRFKKLAQGQGRQKECTLVNIHQPLEEALDLMSYQFKKCQIQIAKSKMDQVLLEANRHSLVQVFMNVFINATHVMPKGGKIDLSIEKKDTDSFEIQIRDHGSGIPADILPKVTEPLFTTKGSQGSGLGLAICKEIIEIEHGGEFLIDNHPQGGVVVTIRLPTRQEVSHEHDEA